MKPEVYKPQNSSNIREVTFFPSSFDKERKETGELDVVFHKNGVIQSVYTYSAVPYATFQGLQRADSAGKYFFKNIKGIYKYKKVA